MPPELGRNPGNDKISPLFMVATCVEPRRRTVGTALNDSGTPARPPGTTGDGASPVPGTSLHEAVPTVRHERWGIVGPADAPMATSYDIGKLYYTRTTVDPIRGAP